MLAMSTPLLCWTEEQYVVVVVVVRAAVVVVDRVGARARARHDEISPDFVLGNVSD
jgi:hypothetical protein